MVGTREEVGKEIYHDQPFLLSLEQKQEKKVELKYSSEKKEKFTKNNQECQKIILKLLQSRPKKNIIVFLYF